MKINEYLEVVGQGKRKMIRCRCGKVLCPATSNYKEHVLMKEGKISEAGPYYNRYKIGGEERFVFREFYCPQCLTLLDVEVAQREEPILWDVSLKV